MLNATKPHYVEILFAFSTKLLFNKRPNNFLYFRNFHNSFCAGNNGNSAGARYKAS